MAPSAVEEPVARILTRGPECLTDREILAVLLDQDLEQGAQVASALLPLSGRLAGLTGVERQLVHRQGLGDAETAILLAAVEFSCRIAKADFPRRDVLKDPEAVARYLHLRYCRRDQEVAGALYLDARNRLITDEEIFRGTLSRTTVEPRQILREGLVLGAAQFIFFHTHPSGDPTPSPEDLAFTLRMAEAGEILGISLLDHMIIGHGGRWISLQRRRDWLLGSVLSSIAQRAPRRKVKPKYRHPTTGETWSGRGRMARWLRDEIEAGAKKEDFLIRNG